MKKHSLPFVVCCPRAGPGRSRCASVTSARQARVDVRGIFVTESHNRRDRPHLLHAPPHIGVQEQRRADVGVEGDPLSARSRRPGDCDDVASPGSAKHAMDPSFSAQSLKGLETTADSPRHRSLESSVRTARDTARTVRSGVETRHQRIIRRSGRPVCRPPAPSATPLLPPP
jgi:hypothetical protein